LRISVAVPVNVATLPIGSPAGAGALAAGALEAGGDDGGGAGDGGAAGEGEGSGEGCACARCIGVRDLLPAGADTSSPKGTAQAHAAPVSIAPARQPSAIRIARRAALTPGLPERARGDERTMLAFDCSLAVAERRKSRVTFADQPHSGNDGIGGGDRD
jgi:hypothetical protein